MLPVQALEGAATLDEVRDAHGAFLGAASRAALAPREQTWGVVAEAVRRLLDLVLRLTGLPAGGCSSVEVCMLAGDQGDVVRSLKHLPQDRCQAELSAEPCMRKGCC